MKKMNIVSGLTALAMSASLLSAGMTAFAADTITATVGKDTVKPGAEYKVTVDLASVPSAGVSSVDFAIDYDSSIIDVTDVTLGTVGQTGAENAEGADLKGTLFNWYKTDKQIIIIWATGVTDGSNWISKDGTFLTISGTAKSTAKNGDVSKLQIVPVDRAAYPGGGKNDAIVFSGVKSKTDITDYAAKTVDGEVVISDGNGTTPEPQPAGKPGDINCDGKIDVKDAVLLARMAGGDSTVNSVVTDEGKGNADVKADGTIDTNDLTLLLQCIVGAVSESDLGK